MALIDWPADLVPYEVQFYLQPHSGGTESPFTGQTRVYSAPMPRWVAKMSFRAPDSADRWGGAAQEWGERIDALLAEIGGRENKVAIWDFRRPGNSAHSSEPLTYLGEPSTYLGEPLTLSFSNAAVSAGDSTIRLTGASTDDIRVGEYVGGDGRPHIITDLVVSGSDLIASVEPEFALDIGAGAAIFSQVSGQFRLTSDDAGANASQAGDLTQYSIDLVEDWAPSA